MGAAAARLLERHFNSYFRFSVGDHVLPREEIASIISKASDAAFIQESLRKALTVSRKDGKTKAKLLLDELTLHADDVADKDVEPLLTAIFELGDELDVRSDEEAVSPLETISFAFTGC